MNITLIPFFLAANVAVNNHWIRGPEWTYNMELNMTLIKPTESQLFLSQNIEVRCRTWDEVTIACVPIWESENYTTGAYLYKFNELGVESLTFEGKKSRSDIIHVKTFGDLISVGVDINKKRGIPGGICNSYLEVTLELPEKTCTQHDVSNKIDEFSFKLVPLTITNWTEDLSVEIAKSSYDIDPATCSFYTEMLKDFIPYPVTIESYQHLIYIDRSIFQTFRRTESTFIKPNDNEDEKHTLIETIKINLLNIHEIEDEILPIKSDEAFSVHFPNFNNALHD